MRLAAAVPRFRRSVALLSLGFLFGVTAFPVRAAPPTGITLSSLVVVENSLPGTVVGELGVVDEDVGEGHLFAKVEGVGATENNGFAVVGNQLIVPYGVASPEGNLDFETEPQSFSIRLRVTDATSQFFEQVFVIAMVDDRTEDADHDGLSERDEEDIHGTSDVLYDTDGDGFGDGIEILGNSSPTDGNDWPDYPLVGWGSSGAGELLAPGPAGFTAVSTGQKHSLGLRADGTVAAWSGLNAFGQTTLPAGLSQAVAVAAGGDFWPKDSGHSLVLKSDGTVLEWGYHDSQQSYPPVGMTGVIGIAAGRSHSLGLKSDGTVVAWGRDFHGERSSVPAGLAEVVEIAAGGFYSLALKSDGSVVAWGDIFNGLDYEPAAVPAGLCDVVAISAGRFHGMALKSDGTVVAWGYNSHGQASVPAGLDHVIAIAAGGFHSLALKDDGSVVGWGMNTNGQVTIPFGAGSGVKSISAGLNHSLALRATAGSPQIISGSKILAAPGGQIAHQIVVSNAVAGQYSALGLPAGLTLHPQSGLISGSVATALRRSFRVRVDTNQGRLSQIVWLKVSAGLPPTAITLSASSVTENSATGTVVGEFAAVDPDAGESHDFELVSGPGSTDNGGFLISGNQLVVNALARDFEQAPGPLSIRMRARDASQNFREAVFALTFVDDRQEDADHDGLTEAAEEDLHGTSDLAYDTDGDNFGDGFEVANGTSPINITAYPTGRTLVAWGKNSDGQATVPAGLGGDVIALAAGWAHSLALKNNGTVAAWGLDDLGQCTVPQGLAGVVAVEAGGTHSLALKSDGTVEAWGGNNDGESTVPANLIGAVAIAAGGRHSLCLKSDGTVVAWGNDDYGQATVPQGLAGVIAIAAGAWHSLALKSDGSVVGWGEEGSITPPQGLQRVVAIAAAGLHNFATTCDGAVVSWGDNEAGQLNFPEAVSAGAEIHTGWLHGIARKQDGTLVPWGSDADGQSALPIEARKIRQVATGGFHNLALRQTTGFPQIEPAAPVTGWYGATLTHQVLVTGATPSHFSAMGLPADLTIDPATGWISGVVITAERRAVRITVDTDQGRLTQILWIATADGRPPVSITLTAAPLLENSADGTVVGSLSASDPDEGDSQTYDVAVIGGSLDPLAFEAVDNQLVIRSSPGVDYEFSGGTLTLRVRVTDSAMNVYQQDFMLAINDDREEDADQDGVTQDREEGAFFTSDVWFDDFATADADHDGVPTLVEYAFNLNPLVPDAGRLLGEAGSTAGLPISRMITDPQGGRHLRMEYLRRIGSGLTYLPEFSSSLGADTWTAPAGTLQITPIDATWERCTIDDTVSGDTKRFGRIGVQQ